MMKRLSLIAISFILAAALAGCGGGTGASSQPTGVNAGVPSHIQVLPVQQIAQTNTYVPVKAKVLDGDGNLLANTEVTFTNLSLVGSLSSTSAKTDQSGIATVNLFSTTAGFSTVQAEVASGSGMVRDKKTVYFSDYDLTVTTTSATPTLTLDVDGNNNQIYNEPSDTTLFETPDDNEVMIRATLKVGDTPVSDSLITFGADTSEGTFPLGNTAHTDTDGHAFVLVKVDPSVLRNFKTVLNITASADDGAANIVSLFLEPVTVDTVSVTAPDTVASGSNATISATVTTTAGSTAPDGTAVSFSATNGQVTPFGQTTSGAATATFTAPTLSVGAPDQQATVTASSGGKSGVANITITAPTPAAQNLQITPPLISVLSESTSQTLQFTISGGTPPYVTTSADPSVAYNDTPGNGVWNNLSTINVTIPADVSVGTVTLNVFDSVGAKTSATITIIQGATDFYLRPVSATISTGQSVTYTIFGGTAPFTIFTDHPGDVSINYPGGTTFTVIGNNATTAVITVRDSNGKETTTTLTVK